MVLPLLEGQSNKLHCFQFLFISYFSFIFKVKSIINWNSEKIFLMINIKVMLQGQFLMIRMPPIIIQNEISE